MAARHISEIIGSLWRTISERILRSERIDYGIEVDGAADFTGISALYIEGLLGDVEISVSEYGFSWVGFARVVDGTQFWEPDYTISGKSARIGLENTDGRAERLCFQIPRHIRTLRITTISGDIEIADPDASIEIETKSGDVVLLNTRGAVKVKTLSGNILAEGAGELNAETENGDITAFGSVGRTTIRTESGDITAVLCSGSIDAETSTGDIYCEHPFAWTGGRFVTNSGDIDVRIGRNLNAVIVATSSGRVAVADVPHIHSESPYRGYDFSVTARLNIGKGGPKMEITSSTGEILIS